MISKIFLLVAAPVIAIAQVVLEDASSHAVDVLQTHEDMGEPGDFAGSQLLRGGSRHLATWNYWEGKVAGYGTFFHGMGWPTGGCGVPPDRAYDNNWKPLPYIALNTNSEWHNGANCGRWVEITLGQNCIEGGNTQWQACPRGTMRNDKMTGEVIYGYVMDQCPDNNFWCKNDYYHLDVSADYLNSKGLNHGGLMAARKLHWKYINWVPKGYSMGRPKFQIKENSRSDGYTFWVVVTIYNTRNGIGRVEQKMKHGWQNVKQLSNLGNSYVMKNPRPGDGNAWTDSIKIRVWGKDHDFYGAFEIHFPCGRGVCGTATDAHIRRQLH